ncbi:MAG: hypothetical protein V4603_08020 [Pseudomonadota bacterium]
MKIYQVSFLAVFAFGSTLLSESKAQGISAFEAFKMFCVDTNIEKDAIRAKAISMGGTPLAVEKTEIGELLARAAKVDYDQASWLVKSDARQFRVNYLAMRSLETSGELPMARESCHVWFDWEEASADSDFSSWVGLTASGTMPGIGLTFYYYEVVDGKRVKLPSNFLVDPTFSKTVRWKAEVTHWPSLGMNLSRGVSR